MNEKDKNTNIFNYNGKIYDEREKHKLLLF